MRDRIVDGPAVRLRRKQRGLTVAALAKLSGISATYIKYIEAGPPPDRDWPSDRLARDLAEALNCYVEDFSHPRPDGSEEAA